MAWFPVLPPGHQNPYDPGPYHDKGMAPIAAQATLTSLSPVPGPPAGAPIGLAASTTGPAAATAAAALVRQIGMLPSGLVHKYPDSNAWAANGPAVAGGVSMLAGDPHLPQTLPSVWYQAALSAPGLVVTGVTVPGLPGVLIGHNQHIAWSLTDTQNQATLFYTDSTPSRPARPARGSTTGAARGGGCGRSATRSPCAAPRRCRSPWTSPCTARS
jgi:penicillin amidase